MRTCILAVLFGVVTSWQPQNSPDLTTVLQRATEYLTRYEEQLGNLIGREEYNRGQFFKDAGLCEKAKKLIEEAVGAASSTLRFI